ncbi:hypothetical protein K4749_01445 [Streptomyces sp. TRM72054]|uniref:hypothetical protein n=1 Tax=Streptomyces sp. TRM72054 TaxID=2870562 RepID=UPI001C8BFF5D|nr:hypothetical protein [Streptomyces sp. TRM72054]MBX9392293.1 hypothetical protein [Streptomyces sp. TRM72054]
MPGSTVGEPNTSSALALLPLPDFNALTQQQAEGHACVWDGIPLTTENAVDLGARTVDGVQRFPRACPRCVGERARAALFEHCFECDPCSQTVPGHACDTGTALMRLSIRQGR